ncbi:MAG: hypothetical protein PHI39_04150 [Kiritimatiellae bacterium]|nr:hypothetical protein [Kiritimatiellia bacterium]
MLHIAVFQIHGGTIADEGSDYRKMKNRKNKSRLKTFMEYSTLWKNIFHTVEKQARFFHAMEKLFANFPHNGKTVESWFPVVTFGCCLSQKGVSPVI